uniref:C2H2-type domain-containing protein n=1 Tax=Anopheles dirus TaxID=7168 RepID=A0A182NYI7_9DIPT
MCAYCDKGFLRRTDLKVHESYHTEIKNYICKVCEKSFHTPYTLKTHMRTHTGEKPYKCPHCPKAFNQNYDMLRHIRRHTGERFKCDKCDESFIHAYLLNSHLKAVHNVEAQFRTRGVNKVSVKNIEMHSVPSEVIKQKD